MAMLAAVLMVGLVACGQQEQTQPVPAEDTSVATEDDGTADVEADDVEAADVEFHTIGDILNAGVERHGESFGEDEYSMMFRYGGKWMCAFAALPEGMYEELDEAMSGDMEKYEELLSTLEISELKVLEATEPTQEELDALVGKTGAELTEMGYDLGYFYVDGDTTICYASDGTFEYDITFEGAAENEDTDDYAAELADMTVSDVSFWGVTWTAFED